MLRDAYGEFNWIKRFGLNKAMYWTDLSCKPTSFSSSFYSIERLLGWLVLLIDAAREWILRPSRLFSVSDFTFTSKSKGCSCVVVMSDDLPG